MAEGAHLGPEPLGLGALMLARVLVAADAGELGAELVDEGLEGGGFFALDERDDPPKGSLNRFALVASSGEKQRAGAAVQLEDKKKDG